MSDIITCNCIAIRQASNNLTRLYNGYLSEIDLKITQYSTLKNINYLRKTTVNELSNNLKLERSTVLRNLDKLKKMNLIVYEKNNIDKLKTIFLSANGEEKLNEANVIWERTQQKFLNAFGLNNQNQFNLIISKINKLNF